MFSVWLQRAAHIRHYSICLTAATGWEVRVEEDGTVTRHVRYHDWHRVERALAQFDRAIATLTSEGWDRA
jgi:hypothetical protein